MGSRKTTIGLLAALGMAVLSAPQASATNKNATLGSTSTIKGVGPSALGDNRLSISTLVTGAIGVTTLSSVQAADTSNAGSFVTLLTPTDAGAHVTKVVFYPSGTTVTAPINTFATDIAYNGAAALTGGGFFVIEATASDTTTTNYYQISFAVIAATADATLKTTSIIKG